MNRLIKSTAILTLSTGVILSSLPVKHHTPVVKAAAQSSIEEVLAKLTPEQRQALKQIEVSSQVGIQLPSSVDLNSSKNLSVIVELKDKPAKVAVIEEAAADVSADLKLLGKGFGDNVESLKGKNLQIDIVHNNGADADYKSIDINGKIALVNRGTVALVDKIKFAKNHGAVAVIIMNNVAGEGFIPAYLGGGYGLVPTFTMSSEQATAMTSKLGTTPTFSFDEMGKIVDVGSKLASFSSRGPARITYDIKPEVTAPGVAVFSTVPSYMHGESNRKI
ncbi:PA domain-containing protein [Gottfriedia acidiceleris]|uniref:PA domain-containing protein n=1 Tax=Gottfriedia acidiceleris TaxID=371036 RepID=UPI00300015B5